MNEQRYFIDDEELMRDWDYENNNKQEIYPDKTTLGTGKRINWICHRCSHKWNTTGISRGRKKNRTGCPVCAIKKNKRKHNKDFIINDFNLMKDWNYEENDKLNLEPTKLTLGSNKKALWKCNKCGYKWEAIIASRTKGHGCPVCSGRIVTKENSLASKNPELAKEWNYDKNGNLTPWNVGPYSEKKVWWRCKNGHEWQASVSNRFQGRGCAKCSSELKSSFPEQAIIYYLSKYTEIESRIKINNWESDIFLPKFNIAIEYDGVVYHSQDFIKEREKKKNLAFEKANIDLIRIKESKNKEGIENNIVYFKIDTQYKRLKYALGLLFKLLSQKTEIEFNEEFNIENDRLKIIKQYYRIDKKNNFAQKYSDLVVFWNYDKNLYLKPENFRAKSNEIVWWKCPICKGEWQESIINITKGNRCPYCSGHRVLKGFNDLKTVNSTLTQEWNYEKNLNIYPDEVTGGSNKKVWWKCNKCDYEWKSTIAYRKQHPICPKCSKYGRINRESTLKDKQWMKMYEYAKEYYKENGNLEVVSTYICEDGTKLGSWIRTQRVSYKNNDLTSKRLNLLEDIDMQWEVKKGAKSKNR